MLKISEIKKIRRLHRLYPTHNRLIIEQALIRDSRALNYLNNMNQLTRGHYMKEAKNDTKPKNEGTKSDQTPNWITNMNDFFGIEPTSTQQLEGAVKSKESDPCLGLDLSNIINMAEFTRQVPAEYRIAKCRFSIHAEQNEKGENLFVIRGTREEDNAIFIVSQFKRCHIGSVNKISRTPDPDIIACASNAPKPPIFLYSLREQKLLGYTSNCGGRYVITHNGIIHDWLLSTE